jgi:nucleotide-binding universal stress UspA family protein
MKPSIKKILVPVDGSPYAEKALNHACELSKSSNASIIIIYVIDKSNIITYLDRKEYLVLLRKFGERTLEKSRKIALKHEVKSKQVLKVGKPTNEIINYSKNENIDLIVVGSRGLGKIAKLLLGSVSNRLANHAKCSVLIVK